MLKRYVEVRPESFEKLTLISSPPSKVITAQDLRRAERIRKEIETLQKKLAELLVH